VDGSESVQLHLPVRDTHHVVHLVAVNDLRPLIKALTIIAERVEGAR
jgi:hypothetical protein